MAYWECQFCTNNNKKIILYIGDDVRVLPNTVVLTKNSKSIVNGCFITIQSSKLKENTEYVFDGITKNNLCSECLILLNSNDAEKYYGAKKTYLEKFEKL